MHALPCCKNASRRHLSNLDHFYHHSTVMHPSCWSASSCEIFSSNFEDFILVKKKLGESKKICFFKHQVFWAAFVWLYFCSKVWWCNRNSEAQNCSDLICFVIGWEICRMQFDFLVHFCLDVSKLAATKKLKGITTLVLELHNFDHSKLHIEIMLAVRIEILF